VIGIVLAAPITVVVSMAVMMIYFEDPLEEHTAETVARPHKR
jgi:hypothetical protein